MAFMDSMFSYWQGGIETAEQGARETEKVTQGEKSPPRAKRARATQGEKTS